MVGVRQPFDGQQGRADEAHAGHLRLVLDLGQAGAGGGGLRAALDLAAAILEGTHLGAEGTLLLLEGLELALERGAPLLLDGRPLAGGAKVVALRPLNRQAARF